MNKIGRCYNFVPVFNKEEKKKYAYLAVGQSLPLQLYKSLHERILPDITETDAQELPEKTTLTGLIFARINFRGFRGV